MKERPHPFSLSRSTGERRSGDRLIALEVLQRCARRRNRQRQVLATERIQRLDLELIEQRAMRRINLAGRCFDG